MSSLFFEKFWCTNKTNSTSQSIISSRKMTLRMILLESFFVPLYPHNILFLSHIFQNSELLSPDADCHCQSTKLPKRTFSFGTQDWAHFEMLPIQSLSPQSIMEKISPQFAFLWSLVSDSKPYYAYCFNVFSYVGITTKNWKETIT